MRITKFLITILFFAFCSLSAEKIELKIEYLSLDVIDVIMEISEQSIKVSAKSKGLGNLAAKMDNSYISKFEQNFLPNSYQKLIDQKDYREDRLILYVRSENIARRISKINDDLSCSYPINPESRDFFSALLYIRNNLQRKNGELWVDANRLIWRVNYQIMKKDILSTKIGKITANKVKITFKKYSKEEKERSDMLTNNLVDENNELYFWFSDDEKAIPLKAVYSMKPFPVVWNIVSYSNE